MASNKDRIASHFDKVAPVRTMWFNRNYVYHNYIIETCRPFITPSSRVLELGCSTGDLLAALNPGYGVGVDISAVSIDYARQNHPDYTFIHADVENLPEHEALNNPFDVIIAEDLVGYLEDIQTFLVNIKKLMHPGTRLIISTWNWLWEPVLNLGERLGLKSPDLAARQNWVSASMIQNLLYLADYETLQSNPGALLPIDIPVLSPVINSFSYAPLVRRLTLLTSLVAYPQEETHHKDMTVSVIIPTRNEVGNIQALVERTPDMGAHTEIIFIDGSSTDGTVEEIHRQIELHPERDIKFMPQVPIPEDHTPPDLMLKLGKGDAVRKGFDAASGDILMILDSDVSIPPEDLAKFYEALSKKKARFANGTRFVYEQEVGAMKPINRLGNVFFSLLFSWLLNQRVTDTLCGTKVLYKSDYEKIVANRGYFGDFDPFGDFDLLFGAAWLRHKIVDIPIHYLARTYGESKVRVSSHGPLLGRMSLIAYWKLKILPTITGKFGGDPDDADTLPPPKRNLTSQIVGLFIICMIFGWLNKKLK